MFTTASIPLVCTYDSEADAAYIYLQHPITAGQAEHTLPNDSPHGMANIDLDKNGRVLGLEIVGAASQLPPALLAAILEHGKIEPEDPH